MGSLVAACGHFVGRGYNDRMNNHHKKNPSGIHNVEDVLAAFQGAHQVGVQAGTWAVDLRRIGAFLDLPAAVESRWSPRGVAKLAVPVLLEKNKKSAARHSSALAT